MIFLKRHHRLFRHHHRRRCCPSSTTLLYTHKTDNDDETEKDKKKLFVMKWKRRINYTLFSSISFFYYYYYFIMRYCRTTQVPHRITLYLRYNTYTYTFIRTLRRNQTQLTREREIPGRGIKRSRQEIRMPPICIIFFLSLSVVRYFNSKRTGIAHSQWEELLNSIHLSLISDHSLLKPTTTNQNSTIKQFTQFISYEMDLLIL